MRIVKSKICSLPWKPKGTPSSLKGPIAMSNTKPSNVESQGHSAPTWTVIMVPFPATSWVTPSATHAFILVLNARMMPCVRHAQKPGELTVGSVYARIRHSMMSSLNFNARIASSPIVRNARERVYVWLVSLSIILSSMKCLTVVSVDQDSTQPGPEYFQDLLLALFVLCVLKIVFSAAI